MAFEPASADALSSSEKWEPSRSAGIDALLAVLICGLAFLLASTPAHNSDLWLHLASGRWLSAGHLPPDGTDPFSSTTQGVFWVNHTWLSDIFLYWIHKLGDGTALVVAKAILTTLLAALLLCFGRRGEGMGVLALGGFAALLAIGPWLLLQPILFSLLGVALTLYLLEGVSAQKVRAGSWLLVPLFALWANLDGWFVLGPVLVGLYAIGELLRRPWTPEGPNSARRLFLLFVAGLIACFATPYHYRIFAWPTPLDLTHTEQALQHDPLGPTLILSPFAARFIDSPLFRSPGAWAYYFLLAAGVGSFVLARWSLHPGRLLVWSSLAALSIYQARTIPFFVVAAAPLFALNVQEWLRRQPSDFEALAFSARRLGVLVAIALLLLAWPGWLQPAPFQPRSWTVEPDGSLLRMTEQLKRWHAQSYFRSDRFAWTFSPEVAHYLAWFCPEEKGFVDSRWPLFNGVADDYVNMRRCLLQGGDDAGPQLTSLLDAHHIDRILLYDADRERTARAYRHLFLAMPQWDLLAFEGGAAVFRRHSESASPEPFDYRRAAYHPAPDQSAPPASRPPQLPPWYDLLRRRTDPGSADREEAALHLLSFERQAETLNQLAQMSGLIGCGSGLELAVRLHLNPPLPPIAPEPLFLAVRAARRALSANPDDARAFLLLGQAYLFLSRQTREAAWQTIFPDLAPLRQAQILTALESAVLLRPDLAQAHALLAPIYFEMGQMDRRLDHLRALLQLAERADKKAASAAALRTEVENAEKLVNQSEKTYQANLTGKTDPSKVLERAQLAARYGLSRKALEMMQESYPAIFGDPGVKYQLDLMMKAGQCFDVLELMKPALELKTDLTAYFTLMTIKARAAAGCGDYGEADAALAKSSTPLRRIAWSRTLIVPVRSWMAFYVAQAVLTRPPRIEGVAGRVTALYFQFRMLEHLGRAAEPLRTVADQQVLRGLLALESGAVQAAEQHLRDALDLWGSDSAAATGAGLDFPARPIAQEMLRRMKE